MLVPIIIKLVHEHFGELTKYKVENEDGKDWQKCKNRKTITLLIITKKIGRGNSFKKVTMHYWNSLKIWFFILPRAMKPCPMLNCHDFVVLLCIGTTKFDFQVKSN
jgi:hypothetical protein